MNKARLKSYAPAARREFIQAVTDRAHFFGLSEKAIVLVEEKGDLAIIGGRPFARIVAAQRKKLEERVKRDGFNQLMEAVAYTWFNRFLALRFMELHGYLEHGFRVLSNPSGSTIPEILDHATQIELPGLDNQKVVELKLDGSKDAELYRIILVAQCNALNAAMPFLFEKIDDETELLLPDNLLHSDSLIRKLVTGIDEEDWQEVEIIGWLYQFYISEKKDQVIGKVVKSEDIPAATQLFTPNWIVKYMVQNSLGRQWLATYPDSPLRQKMEYYIEPAEQTEEVKAQLKAITPDSLNPELLTLLDPASGSGHILVEAYDLLKEIYLERGYSSRDFPRLILEKNLYGLDIDDRAAQMAGFALLMKARKDDRRILRSDDPVKLNVMAIQESGASFFNSLPFKGRAGEGMGFDAQDISELIDLFKHGKTFGSLITVPEALAGKLTAMARLVEDNLSSGDLFAQDAARSLQPLVKQAMVLGMQFDAVVANPPYMGSKGMNDEVKDFAKKYFPDSKSDLFAMFIERGFGWCKPMGFNSMVTMQSWMFLSSYEGMRADLLNNRTLSCMVHMGNGVMGIAFGTAASIFWNRHVENYEGNFSYCESSDTNEIGVPRQFPVQNERLKSAKPDDFKKIPGSPIAYWVGARIRNLFAEEHNLGDIAASSNGVQTGNNDIFVRGWHEVSFAKIHSKWIPYNKGGSFRKWYGNLEYVVNWGNDGGAIKSQKNSCTRGEDYYFQEGITWSDVTSGALSCRYLPKGFIFDASGPSAFFKSEQDLLITLGLLNTGFADDISKILNPTMHFQSGDFRKIPAGERLRSFNVEEVVRNAIAVAKDDWNSNETSWEFETIPWIRSAERIEQAWGSWLAETTKRVVRMAALERENNQLFIKAYALHDELSPEVPEDKITLARADREKDCLRLISYAIGCMMGRYRLDRPGLTYAHEGNRDFEKIYNQPHPHPSPPLEGEGVKTFPVDDDGIIPVMDMDWFSDDAANRFEEFLKVAWSPETLEGNLKFVADSLSPRGNETPRETIRRYMSTQFYKDHLQTYKKRPIYWLFSSGKLRAFECLVYLHRYNETTLSRMRNEYVTPLMGKFSAQIEYLANEKEAASSTAERNKLQKQLDALKKKQAELSAFDDLLRHYADQRISLDLDDGVKVNYGKFGNLLAEVKAITGGED